jgi:hypothetical protein
MAKDSGNSTLAVNDAVKLLGTVTSINDVDAHFCEVTVTLTHPVTTVADKGPEFDLLVPGAVRTISVSGPMLTKV